MLEVLLELSHSMVERYARNIYPDHLNFDYSPQFANMCISMEKELIDLPSFNQGDIVSLILNSSNISLRKEESIVLGIFTSALADILTERNSKEGIETHLFIEDSHLDYLFAYLKKPMVVSIKNSTGDNILLNAGITGGYNSLEQDITADFIKYIFLDNIKGDNLLNFAAKNVRTVQIRNCIGDNIAKGIIKTDILDIQNCKGDSIANLYRGSKNIFAKNIQGNCLMREFFPNRSINHNISMNFIVLEDIIGDYTLDSSVIDISAHKINLILLRNINGNNTLSAFNYKNAHLIYLENNDGDNVLERKKYSDNINKDSDYCAIIDLLLTNNVKQSSNDYFPIKESAPVSLGYLSPDPLPLNMRYIPYNPSFITSRYVPSKCKTIYDGIVKHQIHITSAILEEQAVSKIPIDERNDFSKQVKNYHINEIYDLFNSLKFKDIQNIEKTLSKIDAVYKSIERIDTKYTKGAV